MNLRLRESFTDQQRCRPWIPLFTQQVSLMICRCINFIVPINPNPEFCFQLRLRHLKQITAYNVVAEENACFYYTLHLTSMSAPFYTSEEIDSPNPKWIELDLSSVPSPSATGLCVYSSGSLILLFFSWWQHVYYEYGSLK